MTDGVAGARAEQPDYIELKLPHARVVALAACAAAVRDAMSAGTLYGFAAAYPDARALTGRLPAYALPLPGCATRVVVRHSHHGGLLAPLTRDLFLAPTWAPRELEVSRRLIRAGVRTPELVAYAIYSAGPGLRRSDVATREIADGRDLGAALTASNAGREPRQLLAPVVELLRALQRAGARHPDLNVKNILLAPADEGDRGDQQAWVLDVDRVRFGDPHDLHITEANARRLARSARKWREKFGARITADDLAWLARAAMAR